MKDFNFFSAYSKTREKGRKRTTLFISLAVMIAFIAFSIFTVYRTFELRLKAIQFQIDASRLYITSQDNLDKLSLHNELTIKLENIKSYNQRVENLTESLLENSLIKTGLIAGISYKIPKDTSISSMSVSNGMVDINGTSEREISIAEFVHNLRELDAIDDVFVSSISYAGKEYFYTMSIAVKGASAYVWEE